MNKFHVTVLALLFAGAAVLGAVAVTRTTHLGTAAQQANDAAVQTQAQQLDTYAASLQKQLHAKTPALPKLPKAGSSSGAAAASAGPRIVYHQPPPVVVTVHGHHSEDGGGGGEGD